VGPQRQCSVLPTHAWRTYLLCTLFDRGIPWTHASYAFQLSNSGIGCLHTLLSPHTACSTGTVYVYDHGSSPPLQGALADHMAAGRVNYAWWDPGNFTSRVTR
jgi:hypothetical protein